MEWLKKHDFLSKAIAVLIALILWFYIISTNGTLVNDKIKDISPNFIGDEELAASRNLIVVGEYAVDIEVSGSRKDIVALDKSDILIEADVSELSTPGTYEIPYTVTLPSSSYTLKSKKPAKLKVKIDKENICTVPVKINTDTLAADGYLVDKSNITLTPKELKVSGLQDEISNIAYAEVVLDQKDLTATLSERLKYEFYDSNGKVLNKIKTEVPHSTIDVFVPILKVKELPLSLEINGKDSLKKYVNISFEPKTMLVAGEESILDKMSSVDIGAIKLSEVNSGTKKKFTITVPEGIVNMSGHTEATAKISFDGLEKRSITTSLIEIINAKSITTKYKIEPVTTSLSVEILGTEDTLEKIDATKVRVVADLEGMFLSKGTHPINATIVVDGTDDAIVIDSDEYIVYVKVR